MPDEMDELERQRITPVGQSGPTGSADPWVIKPLEELITRLNFALSGSRLYPPGHPVIQESAERIYQILKPLLESYPDITIQFQDEDIIYRGELLLESSFLSRQLSGFFNEHGVGGLSILSGLMPEEIFSLIYSFRESGDRKSSDFKNLSKLLEKKNIRHIRLVSPVVGIKKTSGTRYQYAKKLYQDGSGLLESVALSAVSQRVVDVGLVRPIVQDLIDNLSEDNSALIAVSSMKSFDNYLFTHSMNVCILSLSFGMFLKIEPGALLEIGIGSILHDIGKVFIPQEIIHKPGKLNDAEWEVIKRHPVDGYKMLLRSKYSTELAGMIVYCHHWRFGTEDGYPQTGKPFPRNPYVSLVTICDCYDAMTTNRPYNRIHLPSDALSIIKRLTGTSFDPQLVYFFEKMLGPYPIGTLVKLNTGEIGVVLRINPEDLERPQIKLILDPMGNILEDINLLDLTEKEDTESDYPNSVVEIVDPTTVSFNVWEYI